MKSFILIVSLIFSCFVHPSNAQHFPLIATIEGRKTTSLNGEWNVIIDPMDYGIRKRYFLDKAYLEKSRYQSYDFEPAPTLQVPADWNTQRQELLYYEGTAWYRKKFEYNLSNDKRLFIHFGAVNYQATVYLNGKELGSHSGGFTPFNFEITELLRNGENSIVVQVNNQRHADGVPGSIFDWWNFGGITRPVTLVETPKTFVADYAVQLSAEKNNFITGWIQLNGTDLNEQLHLQISELNINQRLLPDSSGLVRFEIPAKPIYWSPENPKLYSVHIVSASDRISEKIGFRTIRAAGTDILLNGKKVFLRGVNIHAQVHGRIAHSREDAVLLLNWAKELGCNFVRLVHYPHSEEMIKTAEEMGILVWEELPVYWNIDWANPDTYANAENQLNEMISRDKNRANVIIWSVANETPEGDARLRFITKLAQHARKLDNTRLISSALNTIKETKPLHKTITDELVHALDVVSFNQYYGWFGNSLEDCDVMEWELDFNKPLLMTEFGASGRFGRTAKEGPYYSEDYQQLYYEYTLRMIDRMNNLSGICPWNLTEHRSPLRVLAGIEDGYSRAGLISSNGQRKKAFYTMKAWYEMLNKRNKN